MTDLKNLPEMVQLTRGEAFAHPLRDLLSACDMPPLQSAIVEQLMDRADSGSAS